MGFRESPHIMGFNAQFFLGITIYHDQTKTYFADKWCALKVSTLSIKGSKTDKRLLFPGLVKCQPVFGLYLYWTHLSCD